MTTGGRSLQARLAGHSDRRPGRREAGPCDVGPRAQGHGLGRTLCAPQLWHHRDRVAHGRECRPHRARAGRPAGHRQGPPGAGRDRGPEGSPLARSANADGTPFARRKVAQLALKVEAQRLAPAESRRRPVDVTEAGATIDEVAGAMLNWPARVAGVIAVELGVNPRLPQTILQHHITEPPTEEADRFDPPGIGGDRQRNMQVGGSVIDRPVRPTERRAKHRQSTQTRRGAPLQQARPAMLNQAACALCLFAAALDNLGPYRTWN
jgi:hypothetical protein